MNTKTQKEIELNLLNQIKDRFAGVYSEYYREIIEDMIKEVTDDGI